MGWASDPSAHDTLIKQPNSQRHIVLELQMSASNTHLHVLVDELQHEVNHAWDLGLVV